MLPEESKLTVIVLLNNIHIIFFLDVIVVLVKVLRRSVPIRNRCGINSRYNIPNYLMFSQSGNKKRGCHYQTFNLSDNVEVEK